MMDEYNGAMDRTVNRLHTSHGIRVKMIHYRRPGMKKIPTVAGLIEQLNKKHEQQQVGLYSSHYETDGPGERYHRHRGAQCQPHQSLQSYRLSPPTDLDGLPMDDSAATAPSAPYTSSDLVGSYNNDTSRFPGGNDEPRVVANGSFSERALRSSELERGPPLRNHSINRKSLSFNGKGLERERDTIRDRHPKDDVLPPTSVSSFTATTKQGRPSLRNNFLSGRDPDDLVAMGTNWNPSSSTGNTHSTYRNGGKGTGSLMSNGHSFSTGSTNATTVPSYMSGGMSKRSTGKNGPTMSTSRNRENDPRYSDPFTGAPPSFQQRIAELASLESDTLRYEKMRKLKQKKKADS